MRFQHQIISCSSFKLPYFKVLFIVELINSVRVPLKKIRTVKDRSKYREFLWKSQSDELFIDLVDQSNLQYYGPIMVGTPYQNMTAIYDTGSSVLWVPTQQCLTTTQGCQSGHNLFQTNDSSTCEISRTIVTIQYGVGECQGYEGTDHVSLPSSGIDVIMSMLFVDAESDMNGIVADGIMGLSNDDSYKNLFQLAYSAGQLSSSLYAFELQDDESQSYFYYDVIPDEILSNTVWVRATLDNYWTVKVLDMYMDGVSVISQTFSAALIDTGTSDLVLSPTLYSTVMNIVTQNCKHNVVYGYECPCIATGDQLNNYPNFTVYTDGEIIFLQLQKGAILNIPYTAYIVNTGGASYCSPQIQSMTGSSSFMIFGDTFLRQYTVIFDKDNNKVGFHNAQQMTEFVFTTNLWVSTTINIIVIFMTVGILIWGNKINKE